LAALGVAVAFALVYLHVVLAQNQFRLDRLNSVVAQQQSTYQQLRLQVAQLDSPQHIITTAEGRFGMRPARSLTFLNGKPVAGTSSASSGTSAATAPAGDANWPAIKQYLAGTP
jgi:cell division protein FtsL